ncbi:MAG TPA: hypothetical protein VKU02_06155 [Gemmataceae bacterium]|nr:hypothetical protein [Gemmataceae bacterium]
MSDSNDIVEGFLAHSPHLAKVRGSYSPETTKEKGKEPEGDEETCAAFGYLRGLQDRALAIEFRLRSGDSECYAYSCLVSWRFNPSIGLLVKFTTGDGVTLVLIRGSNLEMLVNGTVNLTDRGLQRHRITWVREMDQDELRKAGQTEPTIDGIDIGDFESRDEQQEWVKRRAPAFLRRSDERAIGSVRD